jgi:hypothetical protein
MRSAQDAAVRGGDGKIEKYKFLADTFRQNPISSSVRSQQC